MYTLFALSHARTLTCGQIDFVAAIWWKDKHCIRSLGGEPDCDCFQDPYTLLPGPYRDPTWSYVGSQCNRWLGPSDWGLLAGTSCNGTRQSPIDLPGYDDVLLSVGSDFGKQLHVNGRCTTFRSDVSSFDWRVYGLDKCPGGANISMTLNDKEVLLTDIHMHAPSEHTVNGRHHDGEMHFVYSEDGVPVAVVAVFMDAFNSTSYNEPLQLMWEKFNRASHIEWKGGLNPYVLFPARGNSSYYTYSGSLTIPPCNEDLQWIVFLQPMTISTNQLYQYMEILSHLPRTFVSMSNSRPTQPLNQRTVQMVSNIVWTYSSHGEYGLGPSQWTKLYPDCGGDSQSPVDLPPIAVLVDKSVAGVDLGEQIQGRVDTFLGEETMSTWKASSLHGSGDLANITFLDQHRLCLEQFHIHVPSEHTVDGKHYDGEVHFVFADDAKVPVIIIGVFLQAQQNSPDNAFLALFWDKFDNMLHTLNVTINPYKDFFPNSSTGRSQSYYTYPGSLATPDCKEGITWMVLTEPASISYAQLNHFRARLARLPQTAQSVSNNRPIQELRQRNITLAMPE